MAEHTVDYRDCLDLAGEIAERIEPSDGRSPYEGDDLIGDCIVPAILPTIRELVGLRAEKAEFQEQWAKQHAERNRLSQLANTLRKEHDSALATLRRLVEATASAYLPERDEALAAARELLAKEKP